MHIAPFATEQYYALYEFSAPHLLSVSDCETVTIGELLDLAQVPLERLADLRLGYTESQGQLALRQAIAAGYERVSPDEVVVVSAPVEGIYLTMRTLLETQDEAIVLTPAYDALLNLAEHVCRRVHRWTLAPSSSGWTFDLAALEGMINPQTKLLVVNFPHNPTGFLPSAEEFNQLLEIVRRHGLWLFCDEMYRGLELDIPALASAADRYERSIVLSGLSKAYGLPGLRAGWLIVKDKTARDALINWKHYTTICPSAPSEFISLAALRVGEKLVARSKAVIRENL
ncbi:MAG: aminotransferase class I/II-fold pyridoxal phosphate-dependent enzyme, partial [Chloroflexi bacterium]|nr:aminotransferase class I/II-fold pyridoxal phosphate-dependent enzyme [Chloroflexota bacterium]